MNIQEAKTITELLSNLSLEDIEKMETELKVVTTMLSRLVVCTTFLMKTN